MRCRSGGSSRSLLDAGNVAEQLDGLDGILIPGGFGVRGIEGKIKAVRYARENTVPFFRDLPRACSAR